MTERQTGTGGLKTGLAEMLKGGVIMDVTDVAQARIAEDAGAVAVSELAGSDKIDEELEAMKAALKGNEPPPVNPGAKPTGEA